MTYFTKQIKSNQIKSNTFHTPVHLWIVLNAKTRLERSICIIHFIRKSQLRLFQRGFVGDNVLVNSLTTIDCALLCSSLYNDCMYQITHILIVLQQSLAHVDRLVHFLKHRVKEIFNDIKMLRIVNWGIILQAGRIVRQVLVVTWFFNHIHIRRWPEPFLDSAYSLPQSRFGTRETDWRSRIHQFQELSRHTIAQKYQNTPHGANCIKNLFHAFQLRIFLLLTHSLKL